MSELPLAVTVNGLPRRVKIADRTMLGELLRDHLGLTGTHIGCEHGVCGACTVFVDDEPVRSCITLAASCADSEIRTIEGLAGPVASAMKEAFAAEHALQCGFCTPGMLVAAIDLVTRKPDCTEAVIRAELSGNLCRCTGYVGIVRAIRRAAQMLAAMPTTG
jgi:carbon-monoxide dehydrogenase small subunit